MILAAHPDDESIGAGGLLTRMRSVVVVHLTNGAPRDRRFWPESLAGTEEYARLRREELRLALQLAGVVDPVLICLDAFDQEAALELPALARGLERLLVEHRPAVLVTHPYEGGHPDHDAAAFVARAAVERIRRAGGPAPLIVEMASYHARDDLRVMEKGTFLEPRGREVVRTLPEETRERKQRMFAAYASQREVLAAFATDVERYRRAPSYDFTRPPCPEPLLYERWRFPLTGRRWRELAAAALRELGR
jgi:LmbE family N-acetylglucosaminyl deacetylase